MCAQAGEVNTGAFDDLRAVVDFAHAHGIVHRDISPHNILVSFGGVTKVSDFGIAKAADSSMRTPTESLKGKLPYMAPEQLEGMEADARTDLFAFGALLYQMATGQPAFQGKTRTSLIAAIVSGNPTPLSQLVPLTPPALERAVVVDLPVRVSRGDLHRDERIPLGRCAELADPHAVRRPLHELHVLDDLVPTRQLRVGADPVSEELLRRLQRRLTAGRKGHYFTAGPHGKAFCRSGA